MNQRISLRELLRHGVAIASLVVGWQFLSRWYLYQNRVDYFYLATFSTAGFGLAFWPLVVSSFRKVSVLRTLMIFALLALILPWGEWLRLSTTTSREDWTRQIYLQGAFLYALFLFFAVFPQISGKITEKTAKLFDACSPHHASLWLPPALFFLFASGISYFVYHWTPVVQDSAAHLFQAKVFRHFRLTAPAPPVPDFFSINGDMLVIKDDRWFGMYQPGLALLLAAAISLHAEWFVPPLLGAFTLVIWMEYARRWHNRSVALLFGVLGAFSPFLILMSSTPMVFTLELLVLSAILFLCRLETEGSKKWRALVLFLLMIGVWLVRSFSSLPFLTPVLVYTGWNRIRNRSFLTPAAIAAGLVVGGCLMMAYNWSTTGNPLLPGYLIEYPDVGFGFGKHFAGTHTPLKSLENISNNLLGLNDWLTGWYSGSLFFLVLFVILEPKIQKWDRVLILCCCGLLSFYFCYFFQDLFFGPRYYYPLAPIVLLLISRSTAIGAPENSPPRSFVTVCLVFSLLSFFPQRANAFLQRYNLAPTYAHYLKEEIPKVGSQKTLVFLDKNIQNYFVNWNDPFLRNPVILCRDLGERNKEAMAAFPAYHPVYFRGEVSFRKGKLESGFRFHDQPDRNTPGYISLFQLAMALETANNYPDRDLFDICYADFFNSQEAAQQMGYLEKEASQIHEVMEYKRNFHFGIIHTARMLLLPQIAFQAKGIDWRETFRPDEFRKEYETSAQFFRASGEIGKEILKQFDKVNRRIDQNRDGRLSDEEINQYLFEKLNIFIMGG